MSIKYDVILPDDDHISNDIFHVEIYLTLKLYVKKIETFKVFIGILESDGMTFQYHTHNPHNSRN